MKQTIGLMLAVAFFCGGLLEMQADVTVLKLYADGKPKLEEIKEDQSDGVPNTWFLINDDVDLLEIIYLEGSSSSDHGSTQFALNGCVNLTNIVVCAKPAGNLIFYLGDAQMDAKTLKIRAVEEQEFRVFYYNEEGEAVFPTDDFWSAPIDKYIGIYRNVSEQTRRGERQVIILAWCGGWLAKVNSFQNRREGTSAISGSNTIEYGWRTFPTDKEDSGLFFVKEPR